MRPLLPLLRSLLASTLSAALILLSPGLPAYAAAGKAVNVATIPAGLKTGPAAVTVAIPSLNHTLSLPAANGGLNVNGALPGTAIPTASAFGAAASANGTARSAQVGANVLAAGAARGASASPAARVHPAAAAGASASGVAASSQDNSGSPKTSLERLQQPLPDFAAQGAGESKDSAAADFLTRVGGQASLASDAVVAAAAAEMGSNKSGLTKGKKGGKETPETPDELDPQRPGNGGPDGTDGLDDLGNPKRGGSDDGPDSRDGGSNGGLFSFAAPLSLGLAGSASILAMTGGRLGDLVMYIPMLLISLILHEMAHARAAYKYGDADPVLQGRTSWKLQDLKSHIDPIWTLLFPIISFMTMGGGLAMANPVQFDSSKFDKPTKHTAMVALAGPATNLALAMLGAIAFAAGAAFGIPFLAGAAAMFTTLNVGLTFFNLLPLFPLDGHHILYALLPWQLSSKLRAFNASAGYGRYIPLIVFLFAGGSAVMGVAVAFGSSLLLGTAAMGAAKITALTLPFFALGAIINEKSTRGPPALTAGSAAAPVLDGQKPVDYVVVLNQPKKAFAADQHLSWVDEKARNSVALYAKMTQSMLAQIEDAGVSSQGLLDRGAAPVAAYKRINAVTLRVDASRAPALKQWLESLGHNVYDNGQRRITPPMPLDPESADPTARGSVGLAENLKISKADSVHKVAAQRYGAPELGFVGRVWRKITGQQAPQPLIGVIDTGADTSHKLLKRVKATKNATSGPNVDDNGHGSWVTSMVLNFAPWLKSVTHYKTFVDGGATLDDILKALTMSANDGNLVISNSWGSDDGDPKSPDSVLVQKLASEGHIMVFAAGNSGSRPNTIGSPAIVQYKDAKTGAIRVPAVAAADRDKKIAYFSSRGPGSPTTKGDPKQAAHRPDLTAIGYNADGAWPANLGPDKNDPQYGPLKAISGTSMSTPAVAGAIALLAMMFGVTTRGEKLDAVVVAVMSTLEKTGQSRDAEGEGFINVEAAYKALEAKFGSPASGFRGLMRRVMGEAAFSSIPRDIRGEYYVLLDRREAYDQRHAQLRSHKRAYDNDLDAALDAAFGTDKARLEKLEKAYPRLKALDGWRGRQWRALAGEGKAA